MRRLLLIAALLAGVGAFAQEGSVHGAVAVVHESRGQQGNSNVVIWLTPLERHVTDVSLPATRARLVQRNKRFEPHVVAVTVGSEIEFPNLDPYFHNVFSIYKGKPFDLGLYESGTSKSVRFTQPGVSYIFCNIHPEMSAAVIALTTRYFAVTGDDGKFSIAHIPPGHYKLETWYEFTASQELAQDLEVVAGENPAIQLTVHSSDTVHQHLNKYGESYQNSRKPVY